MTQLTYDEFIKYLLSGDRALHGEMLPNNYCRYRDDYISGASHSLFYYTDGCAVCYSTSDTGVFIQIHQVLNEMKLSETVSEFSKLMEEYAAAHAVKYKFMFAFVKPDAENEYNQLITKYHYSRISEKYPADAHIRKIQTDNVAEIVTMCEPYLENDTGFGKMLARTFHDYSVYENNLIGYYDDGLVGVASYDYCDIAELGSLNNIYITPEYRGRGIGKAIVRAAMSQYPDVPWLYQADNGNTISQKLALSLGFSLAGKAIMF